MGRKTSRHPSGFHNDFRIIRDMGYDVKRFTPWHFRISKVTRDFHIDVYPTTRTYIKKMNEGYIPWVAKRYKDLIHLVEITLR